MKKVASELLELPKKSNGNSKAHKAEDLNIQITAPKIETLHFKIEGTAPLVQLRFSEKSINMMIAKHEAGSQAASKRKRDARNFDQEFKEAPHKSEEGWIGINASAFRTAMISACRLVGFKMTLAKLSIFIPADGFDKVDGVPLVKLEGKPEKLLSNVRNQTGVADLRMRAKFWPWSCNLKVSYDAGQFSATDITNLLSRVGMQVGIGEGRPDSKESAGMGWGTFKIVNQK